MVLIERVQTSAMARAAATWSGRATCAGTARSRWSCAADPVLKIPGGTAQGPRGPGLDIEANEEVISDLTLPIPTN